MRNDSNDPQQATLGNVHEVTLPPPHLARWATSALFLIDGTAFGIWAGHIPTFKQQFALSNGKLSIALLTLVVGSLVSMPVAGHLSVFKGSRWVATASVIGYCVALLLLSLAPTFLFFAVCALLFGAGKGATDVAINAQAVLIEKAYARPMMSSFQGFWSVGGLCGAGLASMTLKHNIRIVQSFPVEDAFLFCVSILACRCLLPERRRVEAASSFRWPHGTLLWLGLLAFLALFGEGAMADWSAVYLRSSVAVSGSLAALGYGAYSIAMAAGRLSGDWIVRHIGNISMLQRGGVSTAAGLALALGMHASFPAFIGLAIVGLGLSNAVPILFGAAGRASESGPGIGIASVSTLGYLGFLLGPPVIGWLSELVGLRMALGLVILFGVAISALSKRALQENAAVA